LSIQAIRSRIFKELKVIRSRDDSGEIPRKVRPGLLVGLDRNVQSESTGIGPDPESEGLLIGDIEPTSADADGEWTEGLQIVLKGRNLTRIGEGGESDV